MASKRNLRSRGVSHSNHSQNHSITGAIADQTMAPPNNHSIHGEGTQGITLEERIQRMEDTQAEILRLLRRPQQPEILPPPQMQVHPPSPNEEARQLGVAQTVAPHLPPEALLPPNKEIMDTASSTHPSHLQQQHPGGNPMLAPADNFPRETLRDELRRLVQEEYPATGRLYAPPQRDLRATSPFTGLVLQQPIPPGFKLPAIEFYDGTSDPYEHVDHFRSIMHIQRATDPLLCQVFPVTLKGQARTWFYSLPANSIDNFIKLSTLFVEQFIANRRIMKDSSHLSGIRQAEGESLKEYFQRFSNEARQIPGVDPELLRGVFLGGLRPGAFYSALMRETVRTYADLIRRVEAQVIADEAINAHRKQFEQPSGKRKATGEGSSSLPPQKKRSGIQDFPPRPSQQQQDFKYKEYTLLNSTRADILTAIQNEENVKWPRALKPNAGNQDQYCHFHRGKGHTTEACQHLKEEIERLIRQGYLGRFIQDQSAKAGTNSTGGQPARRQPQGNYPTVGEIE